MRLMHILPVLGMTSCLGNVSEPGICAGLDRPVAELRRGLEAHPETPQAVGEAGTDVVLGFEAGCNI